MSRIRGCVFDAYGTLLDLSSAVTSQAAALGPGAPAFLALWRAKQLEYTWLRTLMGRHADFAQVVADALDYACAATGTDGPGLRQALFRGFERLAPDPDARTTLQRLRALGLRSVVLSNGTPAMLEASLVRKPMIAAQRAVVCWNEASTQVPGWPQRRPPDRAA